MNKYFLYAASVLALASCSSDDFLGENSGNGQNAANSVINFGGGTTKTTRATSKSNYALKDLRDNGFWVYGTKHSATEDKTATNDQAVYTNYCLAYTEGSANNTQSNTAGWEYVGVENTSYREHVTPNVNAAQTIKYWDYSAVGYTFYAATANPQDVKDGKVTINKILEDTDDNGTEYTKGYEVTLKDKANWDQLYFADRKVITKPVDTNNPKPGHKNKDVYGGQVNFTFRNALTKVRVAMYEIVPGYSVSIDKFYYTEANESTQKTVATDKFTADANNTPLETSTEGVKYKVVYYNDTEADGQLKNQPKMLPNATGEGAQKKVFKIGDGETLIGSADDTKSGTELSTIITKPTYDTKDGKYTLFMPQADNKTTLNLKVDYTLNSLDGSKEQIHVKGATATIPAKYLCWRPNYAYTYIFKISDNTNGSTGGDGDPAGLYPITFDASVVVTENGNAEFNSAMGESTITTFAVNNDGTYKHNNADYKEGSTLYATVVGNDKATVTLSATNTKLYKVDNSIVDDASLSESLVANWIANNQTNGKLTEVTLTNEDFVNKVPAEDGNGHTITLDPATALKVTSIEAGKYVIEYTGATPWTGAYTKIYKIVTVVK